MGCAENELDNSADYDAPHENCGDPDGEIVLTTTETKSLIRLSDVSKIYRMGEIDVPVLHGVNLDIDVGELMVIVGPSGSGKSTLLNILGER